ncbi:heparan-alpha-glucosaminide N-acetyltransferase domain-containing protein [Pricia sp. S334]|uniref:Heparan-alpha-glucosaminide N-acetyltransferase domain-containing protein n=1 Tax=Pricia mediterranea TaxID=3076079 RepID=A0ABU3L9Y1_9FLAO|nr:acyltransferase family protein [Pricia sp. S334]MDT7830475.1 heparan-alpha-glucosaminide N-acetyltransferase domain-containing protein [Pricia sp. S334]
MKNKTERLYFIDAIRAWAILMMLQGHFVDGLLDTAFRDPSSPIFAVWKYFRGMTAPVFFTVSGFIFTYLLVRGELQGLRNPRVNKGIKRGLELLFIGYLLRTNLLGLLQGELYPSFYLVDVLHCIGLSLLGIIGIYLLSQKFRKSFFALMLVSCTLLLFIFEPLYKAWDYSFLPDALANYLTRANGSVFTIFPWFGYATFGGSASLLFTKYRSFKYLYPSAIAVAITIGFGLISSSSNWFMGLSRLTGIQLFADVYANNYLFIRLGDVLLVFAAFMLLRSLLKNRTVLRIGQSTLSIYVVHFIILYGSFTGVGLYRFFHHALSPIVAIGGALTFILISTFTALSYEKHKMSIKSRLASAGEYIKDASEPIGAKASDLAKERIYKVLRRLKRVKN